MSIRLQVICYISGNTPCFTVYASDETGEKPGHYVVESGERDPDTGLPVALPADHYNKVFAANPKPRVDVVYRDDEDAGQYDGGEWTPIGYVRFKGYSYPFHSEQGKNDLIASCQDEPVARWTASEDAHCLQVLLSEIRDSILCDGFIHSFLETALWSEHTYDNDENESETFYSAGYETSDLSFQTVFSAAFDCVDFQENNENALEESDHGTDRDGRDFLLSRNGHGAGFFDRFDAHSDGLQQSAKTYGEFSLYLGDDGLIYSNNDADVCDPFAAPSILSVFAYIGV